MCFLNFFRFLDCGTIDDRDVIKQKWAPYYIGLQYLAFILVIPIGLAVYNGIDNDYDKTEIYTIVDFNGTNYEYSCYLRDADNCKCGNITYKAFKDIKLINCDGYFTFLKEKIDRIESEKSMFYFQLVAIILGVWMGFY